MARGTGRSLGAAVKDLLGIVPSRTFAQQLAYVTGVKTGATKASVARQLGITGRTLNRWLAGGRASRRSQGKVNALFTKFWSINHRTAALTGNETLKVTSRGITVNGRPRDHLIIEPSRNPRDWSRLRTADPRDISADGGQLFVDAANVEIPYVEFGPGSYTIETR